MLRNRETRRLYFASSYSVWKITGFNLEFPKNGFHLRHPLLKQILYRKPKFILDYWKCYSEEFPSFRKNSCGRLAAYLPYLSALGLTLARHKSLLLLLLFIELLANDLAIFSCFFIAAIYSICCFTYLRRAGYKGNPLTQGVKLFY